MMWPVHLLDGPAWERLSWTLLSFLWQGLVIAAGVELAAGPLAAAAGRRSLCACSCSALALMALCPLVTFLVLDVSGTAGMRTGRDEARASRQAFRPATAGSPASRPADGRQQPDFARGRGNRFLVGDSALCRPCCRPIACSAGWRRAGDERAADARLFRGSRAARLAPAAFDGDLLACAGQLAKRLGMASLPEVSLSERIGEAVVVGLWRPVILLPLAWAMEMPPDVLAAVLAHELAHVRRWDLWVSLAQRVLETLLVLSSGRVVALATA